MTSTSAPWIFGYGSLIWKHGFQVEEEIPARLVGFQRRFWQGSTDHRGTPDQPGRVVTLIEDPSSYVDGVALRLPADQADAIMSHLDHREQGGYEQRHVLLTTLMSQPTNIKAVVYYAGPDNPNYLGAAQLPEIAQQVAQSHGPSGSNAEYVLNLANALVKLDIVDQHVTDLAKLVAQLHGKS